MAEKVHSLQREAEVERLPLPSPFQIVSKNICDLLTEDTQPHASRILTALQCTSDSAQRLLLTALQRVPGQYGKNALTDFLCSSTQGFSGNYDLSERTMTSLSPYLRLAFGNTEREVEIHNAGTLQRILQGVDLLVDAVNSRCARLSLSDTNTEPASIEDSSPALDVLSDTIPASIGWPPLCILMVNGVPKINFLNVSAHLKRVFPNQTVFFTSERRQNNGFDFKVDDNRGIVYASGCRRVDIRCIDGGQAQLFDVLNSSVTSLRLR